MTSPRIAFRRFLTGLLVSAALAVTLLSAGCRSRAAAPLPRVETVEVKTGTLPDMATFGGYLKAQERASVSAATSGVVSQVLVREGARVTAGQPLLHIDNASVRAKLAEQEVNVATARAHVIELQEQLALSQVQQASNVRQAELAVNQARLQLHETDLQKQSLLTELRRKQRLYKGKAVPYTQVEAALLALRLGEDRVREAHERLRATEDTLSLARSSTPKVSAQAAQLDGARTSLTQALTQTEKLRVSAEDPAMRSPVSGTVVTVSVSAGQSVSAGGAPLFVIVNNKTLALVASVDQRTLALIHKGAQVWFSPLAEGAKSYAARLSQVIPAWDEATRTVKVTFDLTSSDASLVDGLAVRVRLRSRDFNGVLVPVNALGHSESGDFVVVIDGATAKRREVTVAIQNETHALVTKGLTAGEKVAMQGVQDLSDGATVKVLDTQEEH